MRLLARRVLKSQRGVTLVEMLVVLAVIGVLSAIIVPNVGGFFGASKETSWKGDRDSIQAAVDGYRSKNSNLLPILSVTGKSTNIAASLIGNCPADPLVDQTSVTQQCILNVAGSGVLVSGGFLPKVAASASSTHGTGLTGSYTWVLKSNGQVDAYLDADATKLGFQTGIYP